MQTGKLASLMSSQDPGKVAKIFEKVMSWIVEGFASAQEAITIAKDEVEAFRKVSEIERYLESDLAFFKGLLLS